MPFRFTCPHCATKTQVDDQYSGKMGQCVACGGEIQLPLFTDAAGSRPPAPVKAGRSKDAKMVGVIAATVACLLIFGGLLMAIIRWGGQTMTTISSVRVQATSIRKLEKIAAAMNAYAAIHGSYPPQVSKDSSGAPLHSWRVLLLPYLDEDDLYDRLHLELPWDHPSNRILTDNNIPQVFVHPTSAGYGYGTGASTAYYLITGAGTLFPPSGPLSPADVTDDVTQTLLVVEGLPIYWADPVDLPLTAMRGYLADSGGSQLGGDLGGVLEGGVAVATVDGRGHFIEDTITTSDFLALVTPQGNERLADDTLD